MSGGESAREMACRHTARCYTATNHGRHTPKCDKLYEAIAARDASHAAREATLREALERIRKLAGGENGPGLVCTYVHPGTVVAECDRALSAPGTQGREGT